MAFRTSAWTATPSARARFSSSFQIAGGSGTDSRRVGPVSEGEHAANLSFEIWDEGPAPVEVVEAAVVSAEIDEEG